MQMMRRMNDIIKEIIMFQRMRELLKYAGDMIPLNKRKIREYADEMVSGRFLPVNPLKISPGGIRGIHHRLLVIILSGIIKERLICYMKY